MDVAISPALHARSRNVAQTPLLDVLRCARCSGRLEEAGDALTCGGCAQTYPVTDGIPQFFVPNEWGGGKLDVTDIVKQFYEETPFPNYDDLDSRESLQTKARLGVFARLLDEQIQEDALVFEAGCGTGQLTNFLGMNWRRRVIGADLCMNSLRLGKDFRDRFAIVNANFMQMNLFRPPFADASMDVVICNGVLHHTADPEGGFRAILANLKPGGYIVIGLYNWLGRLPTLWQRRLSEVFGDRSAANAHNGPGWHPHASRHSIDEVMRWFGENRVEFMSSIPSIGDVELRDDEPLFAPHPLGTRLGRLSSELEMLVSGGKGGGLF